MRELSVSAAWEETKAILARDGRLLLIVALALVALPAALNSLINPGGLNGASTPIWVDLVALAASLVALAGQLSLIRLALGPSITVGSAIAHGVRRMPIYFVSVLIIVIGLVILAVPLVFGLAALGVPIPTKPTPSPGMTIAVFLFCALVFFIGVRLIMSAPVASAEAAGPVAILRRSWDLTAGHWWQLFGFLLIFLIGAIILILAIGSATGVVIGVLFGTIRPLSAGALVLALVQALVSAGVTTMFAVMLARIYLQLSGREAEASVPSSGI